MLRPHEGHDLHIEKLALVVKPSANVRGNYGNSIAVIAHFETFSRRKRCSWK